MDGTNDRLIAIAEKRLKGIERRLYQAEVCHELCDGKPRAAEQRFGWSRKSVQQGINELKLIASGDAIKTTPKNQGDQSKRSEVKNPQLAIDIRTIVEPRSQCDPEMKSERVYTNMTSKEVQQALLDMGYEKQQLPATRTIRDILNRMNYRLKRIQKGKPIKKTEDTDAIFDNVRKRHEQYENDDETLEISVDTKAKLSLGEYSQGGKTRTDSQGNTPKALDHDTPSKKS
jgi:hypothetical protein